MHNQANIEKHQTEMFGKIIYKMYKLTLSEYAFYIVDSFIYIICLVFLFIGIFKYHRKV